MDRDEVFRRMRGQGYTWYGDGEDDRDGVFVKEGIPFGGIAWAIEYLLPWRPPVAAVSHHGPS